MRLPATLFVFVAGTICPLLAAAEAPAPLPAERVHQPDDRLILSASGSTLTGASGGGGGAVNWLRDVSPGTLVGVGVEYQTIADAHWTFGSLRGALTLARDSNAPLTLWGEVHQGSGRIDVDSFRYSVGALGISRKLTGGLSLQLEGRQIDIDTTHGNLPKLGLSYVWNPRLLTSVSYAYSVGGNLGTELFATRVDYYGPNFNVLAGGGAGQADPAVVNLQGGTTLPGRTIKQVFLGTAKPFGRAEWMLVGDYLDLAGSERVTLTLSCTIHLRAR